MSWTCLECDTENGWWRRKKCKWCHTPRGHRVVNQRYARAGGDIVGRDKVTRRPYDDDISNPYYDRQRFDPNIVPPITPGGGTFGGGGAQAAWDPDPAAAAVTAAEAAVTGAVTGAAAAAAGIDYSPSPDPTPSPSYDSSPSPSFDSSPSVSVDTSSST
jgi:hypothetical protein